MGLLRIASSGVIFSVSIYILKVWANGPICSSDARLDGKVVIVTGANTGIGKETALDFVKRGAKVYLACRSLQRGSAAANDIKTLTSTDDDQVLVRELNLGSLASVRAFAKRFKTEESKVDILVNNAGTLLNPLQSTDDGFEMQMGVNHLGHFLLTLLLAEPLKAAAPSRVVVVASGAHRFAQKLGLDEILYSQQSEETYGSRMLYARSKLYNILFVKELARRLEGTGVTTYSLHPGLIVTDIPRNLFEHPVLVALVRVVTWPFFKDILHGAQTTICAAVDPALATESGKYYRDTAEDQPNFEMLDNVEEAARQLWDISVKHVKVTVEETDSDLL